MTATSPSPADVLTDDMTRFEVRLNRPLLDELHSDFVDWRTNNMREDRRKAKHLFREARKRREAELRTRDDRRKNGVQRDLLLFLRQQLSQSLQSLYRLAENRETLRKHLATTPNEHVRRDIILDHAELLGADAQQIIGDRRAFSRWFDEDAMFDRYQRRRGETEQLLTFQLDRFAKALHGCVNDGAAIASLWRRLSVDGVLLDILAAPTDSRTQVAALRVYLTCIEKLPQSERDELLSGDATQAIIRYAMDKNIDVWLQCHALSIITRAVPDAAMRLLQNRLLEQSTDDDIFVRRHVVRELIQVANNPKHQTEACAALAANVHDASVFVRQQLATGLWEIPGDTAARLLRHFLTVETHPQVIAATLSVAHQHVERHDLREEWQRLWPQCVTKHSDEFVIRTCLHAAKQWVIAATQTADLETIAKDHAASFLPIIDTLQSSAESVRVRRWAAHCSETIRCYRQPTTRRALRQLSQLVAGMNPGQSRTLPRDLVNTLSAEQLGRVLAVLAQDDYGYDVQKWMSRHWLTRQPVFRHRVWRILHELRTPATDKRQAFSHTIARVSTATMRIPSQIMGELSRTKVPGEPFLAADEGSWRPYLPLTDDFVSLLNISILRSRTMEFFTSQGVTRVTAPATLAGRVKAWCRLTWRFAECADRRDWRDGDGDEPAAYLEQFTNLGFQIAFEPYTDEMGAAKDDSSVTQFFGGVLAMTGLPLIDGVKNLIERYASYFYSAFDNTMTQLLVFSVAFALFFVGRHWFANWRLARSRKNVPLFLGGWGTRGKSGTERLKAALVGAMGYGLVSKTTGCEAMFIHGDAFGDPIEIPLFRPYDKATIWEHANVIHMANRLDSSVFLWECMGLNPGYVDVLQRQWSRDDLATITNTYPDHEDIQGPAGYNVACTIAGFVPRNAHVITTEQEMRPIVRRSCREVGSTLRGVGWLESGLIPDEILDRFPYREHPDNIALVTAMADELGVPHDFALKGMADGLIPDLGVLKTYPVARIRSRYIEFTNGMSANERFGCLGNWTRLGYDKHDSHTEPETWVTTVINNRADRVARSKVFASIIVNDVAADRHFLIGTNLKGLSGFVADELDKAIGNMSLSDGGKFSRHHALQTLTETASRYRQPTSLEHVGASVRVMLDEVCDSRASDFEPGDSGKLASALKSQQVESSLIDAIRTRHEELLESVASYERLAHAITTANESTWSSIDEQYRQLARVWFERKLVVIDDSAATGEQIIDCIVRETPPGITNRVMGMQNIKGTGLDFIYRFQDWNACYEACAQLTHHDASIANKGLDNLRQLPVLGQLCDEHVRGTIATARDKHTVETTALDELQTKLDHCRSTIDESRSATAEANGPKSAGLIAKITSWLEDFFDVNDSLRRRARADQIYADLTSQRISRHRAIAELRKINKRQKGGWLSAAVNRG